jgi:dolichol-phosphate mannosyltransferase
MRRPFLAFLIFVTAYVAVIGWGWFQQTGSGGELLGHAAKIEAIVRLLRSGDFAWFPDYLSGSPAATLLSFALAIPIYAAALLAPSALIGMKAMGLALVALGGIAAFAFGRRLTEDGWAGFAVGCAYLLAPQVLLRLGWQEHMTIVVAIPLVPLAFLAMLRVAERGAPFDGVLLGVTFSAALLAWSKMGATLAIPLALFAGWLFVSRSSSRPNLVRGALWAIPTTVLLGVVPLLPLLRERGFMTVFELDPFRQWQAAYSAKAATAWLDRGGELFATLPRSFSIDHGGYYLGIIGLAAVAIMLVITWREGRTTREFAAIRIFLLLALLMFWVSLGPRSVFSGHFELLSHAEHFPDPAISLHWLALAAQGVVLFWCLPPARWRGVVFAALFAVYLFLPAFRILERFPLYADLRAPDSFWILNGTFAWSVASALAVVFVLRRCLAPRLIPVLATVVTIAACADFAPYFAYFHRGGLDATVASDFRDATEKLRDSSDRILAYSGRYFYLDLPNRVGRPMASEALNRYLMPADTARLQTASRASAADTLTYFQLAGISDVLVERHDRDIPDKFQKWIRSLLPMRFENPNFFVLSNPSPLYPAFFAESAVPATKGAREYADALAFARDRHVTIADPNGAPVANLPGMKSSADAATGEGPDFVRLVPVRPRTPSHITVPGPGKAGWIVLGESWHPDWKALIDGSPASVYRAAGGFPAVAIGPRNREIEFRFQPPTWYLAALSAASVGWLAALGLLVVTPFLPPPLRRRIAAPRTRCPLPAEAEVFHSPVVRPVALIPTYNETETITTLLDRILAASPQIEALVIDDGSPDGTAAQVRNHPAHAARVHLLERNAKQGLGSAYRAGFKWAIEHGYDAVIEIDADLSHDPADIPRLLAALNSGADAAIGSRYLDGVRVINWPEHRLILSAGASRYVRAITGLPLTDATSGFKALRTAALHRIDWNQLRTDGYGFQVELHWLLWTAGCRIVEIPIVFTERRVGQTKMTLGIAVEAATRVLQLGLLPPYPQEIPKK